MWARVVICVLGILMPASAFAADWYTGAKPQAPGQDWIVSVDGSVDITTQASYFGDVVVTGAPVGTLDQSGLRIRADGLGGRYSYFSSNLNQTVTGTQETGTGLIGYEWVSPAASYAAYVGADIRNNKLSALDPENPVIGTSVGAKIAGEFYVKPSLTTMVAGNASFATNKTAYFARLRGGYLIGADLYVGPEVLALGDAFFNQGRVGVHLTGLQAGPMRFAFAAGFLHDAVRGNGGYTTVDARVGF